MLLQAFLKILFTQDQPFKQPLFQIKDDSFRRIIPILQVDGQQTALGDFVGKHEMGLVVPGSVFRVPG